MASLLLRRSGVAVGLIAELIGWRADLIIQVGVGIHHEGMDVLKEEWPGVEIIGFEPHPGIVKGVRDKYPGTIVQCAIGDRKGKATLHSKRRHKDGSSLYPHIERDDEEYTEIEVPITTLDAIWNEGGPCIANLNNRRIMLWLDCEGHELAALRGAAAVIGKVEVVNVELTTKPAGIGWCRPAKVHDWLKERGFWYQWVHTQRSSAGQTDAMYVRGNLFDPRYCCIPHEVKEWEG